MELRDWSSDVCSSDLHHFLCHGGYLWESGCGPWVKRAVFGQRPFTFNTTVIRRLREWLIGGKSRLRTTPYHFLCHGVCLLESGCVPRGIFVGIEAWPMDEKSRLWTTPLHFQHHGDSWIERMAHGRKESSSDNALIISCATGDICWTRGVAHG